MNWAYGCQRKVLLDRQMHQFLWPILKHGAIKKNVIFLKAQIEC